MGIINYEDAVETALLNGLKEKFCIDDKITLIKYLFSRCAILHGADSIKDATKFMSFVLQELCIPYSNQEDRAIIAQIDGCIAIIDSRFNNANSLLNIYESFSSVFFVREYADKNGEYLNAETYIKNMLSDVQRRSTLKLRPHKNSRYKMELQMLFKLQCLNEDFHIKAPDEAPVCPEFDQRDIRTSIESLYSRYIHADNFDTTNVHSVTEAQVRDYLYANLDLIESGLRPIMKEYPTKEGRVDIVARDKDDVLVVIEVKTENDKRLIWQCMYYPDEVWKKMGRYGEEKKVRMIAVAPEYPEYILNPIERIGYVESYTYSIRASNNVIENISVEKLECEKHSDVDESDSQIGDNMKSNLDSLINSFIYTKKKLDENEDVDIEDDDSNEVALKLVEIAWKTSRSDNV